MTEIIENAIDAQLVKSIEGIPFVCLFSILCFGQKLIGLKRDGPETCLNYDHPSGSQSLKCSAGFKFETLNDTNFHTVAIYGNHYYDSDKLNKLSAKNFILKDLKLDSSQEWEKSGTKFEMREMRQSLTLMDVKLSSYTNRLHFYHIYIERSDLSTVGSISAANLPPKLRTLSLVSCLIKDLPPGIFSHTKSLEMLTITRNSLTSFKPSSFSKFGLVSLWSLDLSFNKIDHIPEDFVVYFPNLAEINLQSNHLQILPEQPFLRKWIDIDIVNLDANALICEKLLWSTKFKPHPIFFDSAECNLEDFSQISLGSLSLIK